MELPFAFDAATCEFICDGKYIVVIGDAARVYETKTLRLVDQIAYTYPTIVVVPDSIDSTTVFVANIHEMKNRARLRFDPRTKKLSFVDMGRADSLTFCADTRFDLRLRDEKLVVVDALTQESYEAKGLAPHDAGFMQFSDSLPHHARLRDKYVDLRTGTAIQLSKTGSLIDSRGMATLTPGVHTPLKLDVELRSKIVTWRLRGGKAVCNDASGAALYDMFTGEFIQRLSSDAAAADTMCMSRDGRYVMFEGKLHVLESAFQLRVLDLVRSPAWARFFLDADGDHFLFAIIFELVLE